MEHFQDHTAQIRREIDCYASSDGDSYVVAVSNNLYGDLAGAESVILNPGIFRPSARHWFDSAGINGQLELAYKDIHAHPELSMQEHRTSQLTADHLRAAGYSCQRSYCDQFSHRRLAGCYVRQKHLLIGDSDPLSISRSARCYGARVWALAQDGDALKLWYRQPGGAWTQALPVGNGRLAAMCFVVMRSV
jgi:hypothetical protein